MRSAFISRLANNDPVFIGALFAFLMLSQRVSGPLMQMAQLINQYDEARSAVATVGNLVNQPAEEGRSGHGVRSPIEGNVEFSNVTFRYKGAVSPSLNGISFEVSRGTTLGVMGKSGSGKTTITRLLQRLHSDYDGLIKIDGIDVREYDVDHLRRNVSIVLQENFLFSGTIRENICAAVPDATFDDIVKAARTGRRGGIHRQAAARLRNPRLRRIAKPLRRTAAAACDCACADRRSADPHS